MELSDFAGGGGDPPFLKAASSFSRASARMELSDFAGGGGDPPLRELSWARSSASLESSLVHESESSVMLDEKFATLHRLFHSPDGFCDFDDQQKRTRTYPW